MTLTAFFLIFLSVFLHAGWNFLSKVGRPSFAFYGLMALTSTCLMSPFLLFFDVGLGEMSPRFWLLLLCSGVSELLYEQGLCRAYRRCDISLAYPMVRALPVLLVAVVTILFGIGKTPGPMALTGMLVVMVGCLLMPLRRLTDFRISAYVNPALGAMLLAAVGTTGYTVLDSLALAELIAAGKSSRLLCCCAYLCMIEFQIAVGIFVYVWRHPREQVEFRRIFLKSFHPHLAGIFSAGAYILVLLAMGFVTNVSYIQAFRQMSLPLGVLAGILILKESHPPVKLAGIALVVGGLLLTSL